jgi:predicted nucleic acid-binding protein
LIRSFVADASATLGWLRSGQADDDTASLLQAIEAGATIEVPAVWPLEVVNALTVLVRRRILQAGERQQALAWLRALPVRVDHDAAALAFTALAALAEQYDLSVYDAAYLELAKRRNLPFCCKDGPLRRAAAAHGVALWQSA